MSAFFCVVLSCVGRGLGAGLIPRPRSPTKCPNGSIVQKLNFWIRIGCWLAYIWSRRRRRRRLEMMWTCSMREGEENFVRGCIQKFPDWPPGARTANGKLSAARRGCIAILWISLVSFAAITLCVASQRVFVVVSVYFVMDSVRKLLDTPSYSVLVEKSGRKRSVVRPRHR
jgi:hypothetical protein